MIVSPGFAKIFRAAILQIIKLKKVQILASYLPACKQISNIQNQQKIKD